MQKNTKKHGVYAAVTLLVCVLLALGYSPARSAAAEPRTAFGSKFCINSQGGNLLDGSDGMGLEFNKANSGEQIMYGNYLYNWDDGDVGVFLNIGGTMYTTMNGSNDNPEIGTAAPFDTLAVTDLTGSAEAAPFGLGCTGTGSGSMKMTYTKTIRGLAYQLVRTISYTSPNAFYTDSLDVVVPAGNTAKIKLYKGGDVSPGNSNDGRAALFTTPIHDVMSVETTMGLVMGMREIAQPTDMSTFEGAVAAEYNRPYTAVRAGRDIGFFADPGPALHDPGYMIQFDIGDQRAGAAAGTYHEEDETYAGFQKVNVYANWSGTEVTGAANLNVTLTNAFLVAKPGLGFDVTVPSPLVVGAVTNGCGGTTSTSGNVVHVSGVSVAGLGQCVLSIAVTRPSFGDTTLTSAAISGMSSADMLNMTGTSQISFINAAGKPLSKARIGANFVLGLLDGGSLITWGMNRENQATIPSCCATGITDIAVGTNFAVALKGGKVYGWGANNRGQLQFPTTANSNITALAAGGAHVLALTTKGNVIAWGDNRHNQASPVPALAGVTAIAAGTYHSLALRKDGTVVGWGRNDTKQANPPAGLSTVVAIAGGMDHSLALKKNGSVVAWGSNNRNQSAVPKTAVDIASISAGNKYSLAVKTDGTPLSWGDNSYGQRSIPPIAGGVLRADAGYTSTVITLKTGGVLVIGDQRHGVDATRTPVVSQ